MAEYQHIEYKLSLGEKHEAAVALAAFATAQGGEVHIGIAPDGRRSGVQIGKHSLEELANYIKQNTDPPLFPDVLVEGEEGERWGTGTLRMADAYTAQKLPPPEFLYQTGSFIVRMQPCRLQSPRQFFTQGSAWRSIMRCKTMALPRRSTDNE